MKVVNLNCIEFNQMRSRRKRYNTEQQTLAGQKVQENTSFPVPKKIVFAQKEDYVMEIDDGKLDQNKVKLLNCDMTENQKKDAFKKKLRKYSHQVQQADLKNAET